MLPKYLFPSTAAQGSTLVSQSASQSSQHPCQGPEASVAQLPKTQTSACPSFPQNHPSHLTNSHTTTREGNPVCQLVCLLICEDTFTLVDQPSFCRASGVTIREPPPWAMSVYLIPKLSWTTVLVHILLSFKQTQLCTPQEASLLPPQHT